MLAILLLSAPIVEAADIPVRAKKLVVLDKRATSGTAAVLFKAKDRSITKGSATNPAGIGVRLVIDYTAAAGQLEVPPGATGWRVNDATVAKFLNPQAPLAPTQTSLAIVKPGRLLTLKAKGLGERMLDLIGAGAPADSVLVNYEVTNGNVTSRHCTEFPAGACTYSPIAGDTGAKLVCRDGIAVGPCAAPICSSYQGCAEEELCWQSRCIEEAKVFSLLPAEVAEAAAQPHCVPRAEINGSEFCYLNDGACTPGCAVSMSIDSVDASWLAEGKLRVSVRSDLSSSVPIDSPFVPPCTAQWEMVDHLSEYEFFFAHDGSITLVNVAFDESATYSGCSNTSSHGDIIAAFTTMALAQTSSAIGAAIESLLQQ
ncbi:MAG TPA: hypothetical protein VEC57_05630 [Candidatus Limnocylindrales bacterium]|nr:hypothetical protein [Candidatus Limnocylindrales bacterium]